ncbi:TetR/AcrR family transcriptional regulator [Trujillonella humicola]|uniref:TetR/AcrR family transcriptional regulator n=1 Tax=Trujillonella humicola TaxID=3383699 RepID=UPI00390577C2
MTEAAPLDRRQRRRRETIEQVLDVAAEVMAEQGVAGLTLGEVARRMGIRPPSLYVYFDGKNALYDALFERGWRLLLEAMASLPPPTGEDAAAEVRRFGGAFVRWAVEHPAYAPLMFWRPVPGFTPSAGAYAPAVEMALRGRAFVRMLRDGGALAADTDVDLAFRTWTAVVVGVISQQLSNAPDEPFETGAFTVVLPHVLAMWLAHHSARGVPSSD